MILSIQVDNTSSFPLVTEAWGGSRIVKRLSKLKIWGTSGYKVLQSPNIKKKPSNLFIHVMIPNIRGSPCSKITQLEVKVISMSHHYQKPEAKLAAFWGKGSGMVSDLIFLPNNDINP